MNINKNSILTLCQDETTFAFIKNTITSQTNAQIRPFYTNKEWKKNIKTQILSCSQPILLIALGPKTKDISPILASLCNKQNGLCLSWYKEENSSFDTWILCQLLRQHGAIISNELSTLLITATIFQHFNSFPHTKIKIENNGLSSYLISSIDKTLLSNKGEITVKTDAKGFFIVQHDQQKLKLQTEPRILGKAIENIFLLSCSTEVYITPGVDHDIINLIARPPSRILSETASKKLLSAVEMNFPLEQLCNSANAALSFAKMINCPVTLKLVKPNLLDKEEKGAILKNIQGASAIQKGYQHLVDLADLLPPPKPLGVLVAKYIETDELYWIKFERNKKWGKILFLGKGEEHTSPLTAFSLPIEPKQISSIIYKHKSINSEHKNPLAKTIFQFSVLIENTGPHIKNALINPIYISPENISIIQDAVIEVG